MSAPETIGHPSHASENPRRSRLLWSHLEKVRSFRMNQIIHLEGASTGVVARVVKRRPDYWFQARRRFFLKNYGRLHTALVDAAFLGGFALWRLRRWLQRKPDTDPPYMLVDSLRHSVFCTGFKLRNVENPAMHESVTGAAKIPN